MAFYHKVSIFTAIVLFGVFIFYFIEGKVEEANQFLFFSIYGTITIFVLTRSLYYKKHKATFNELFFVVGLPILPLIFSYLGTSLGANSAYSFSQISVSTSIFSNEITFLILFSALLSIPYLFFSLFLLLRSFIRYKFIRWGPHSNGGLPGTLIGLLLAIGVGIGYTLLSIYLFDLILVLFGIIYAVTGIIGFFA